MYREITPKIERMKVFYYIRSGVCVSTLTITIVTMQNRDNQLMYEMVEIGTT